jgi:hypothetical protein
MGIKFKEVVGVNDTGQKEGLFVITNNAIILLDEIVNKYIQDGLGDVDDPKVTKLKTELKSDLHTAVVTMNPS